MGERAPPQVCPPSWAVVDARAKAIPRREDRAIGCAQRARIRRRRRIDAVFMGRSVDAAHAVDRDFLDEGVRCDGVVVVVGRGLRGLKTIHGMLLSSLLADTGEIHPWGRY